MENMKTPGVYIVEKNAFPNSVVAVATAIPAFIGYTQKAIINGRAALKKPVRIRSLKEFQTVFGGSSQAEFDLKISTAPNVYDLAFDNVAYELKRSNPAFILYQSVQLFFLNGGGACYIVSVGDYSSKPQKLQILDGISSLEKEQEPTLLVIPDAMSLTATECYAVQEQMILHCGTVMKNRFAILDIYNGYQNKVDSVAKFRKAINNTANASYSAAYYPWLNTAVLNDDNVSLNNISAVSRKTLISIVEKERADLREDTSIIISGIADSIDNANQEYSGHKVNKMLKASSTQYVKILQAIKQKLNLLPPSGAMAGLYTMTDITRGVWKAPANISIASVISPVIEISSEEQVTLNVDVNDKSINAIRLFPGEGTLVWGARTLESNSLDWRYVSVRRTIIMLEQSIKLATKAYVFEPNDSNTWVTIKSMITNFLTSIWKQGGLAGSSPSDAFSISIGLGETMTSQDVLNGLLIVSVGVAMTRPAEFTLVTFTQQMQKS
jgi:phage tail sheath protein FI